MKMQIGTMHRQHWHGLDLHWSNDAANPWVLFESIPEMVVVVDTDGLILYANDHCSRDRRLDTCRT